MAAAIVDMKRYVSTQLQKMWHTPLVKNEQVMLVKVIADLRTRGYVTILNGQRVHFDHESKN